MQKNGRWNVLLTDSKLELIKDVLLFGMSMLLPQIFISIVTSQQVIVQDVQLIYY